MLILPGFGEALPVLPDRCTVGDGFRVAEEPAEVDTVHRLALQLGVAEAVPGLEHQELHHGDGVHVGSASMGALVVEEALDYGAELFPVDEGFYFG